MLKQLKEFVDRLRGGAQEPSTDAPKPNSDFEDPERRLDHARTLADRGEHTRAAHHFRRVLDARPEDGTVHREYADLLATVGYHESAARHYERAVELSPDATVHEEFASLLAEKGEQRKAARQQEQARTLRAT